MTKDTVGGRFQVGEELGAGAVGTVYRATDVETGEHVALKKVRGTGTDFARFSREAQSLARLEHPGVVRYIAHGLDESGTPYLVMEWLEGEDLKTRLARGPLTQREGVVLARAAAETLAAVHAIGLVHRDIKPGNLFLIGGRLDKVKLIDFGLARGGADGLSLTRAGTVIGTPGYMAPEQVRGERTIDHRADLFSLGCVLYKCLCGTAPFVGPNLVAVITRVLLHEPRPLASLVPDIAPALADLVHRLLAKETKDRPQSAEEVLAALDALVLPDPVEPSTPAPSSGARSRRAGLSGHERRVVAALLVGAEPGAPAAALPFDAGASVDLERQVVGLFLVEHKAHMDRLPGGTRVITPTSHGTAADQARWAARCALALRAIEPLAPMALAMGYMETTKAAPAGDVVDRGSALLDVARARAAAGDAAPRIAVDDATAALLDAWFEVPRDGGSAWLEAARHDPMRARTLLGHATPTVGREWEMSTISGLFLECVRGPAASAVLATGAAGMGKTRLAQDVARALRKSCPQAVIWWASGDPARAGTPFNLAGRVLQNAMGFERNDTSEAQRHRLLDRAGANLPFDVAERAAVILGEMASAPFSDDLRPDLQIARGDAALMEEEMRSAWEVFVAAECAVHPVALIIDDLQWADVPSVRLIEAALQTASASPFMLLLFGRPEVHERFPRLCKDTTLHELRLKPLTPKAGARLVGAALGDAAPSELPRVLTARAEGNPFFLEELILSSVAPPPAPPISANSPGEPRDLGPVAPAPPSVMATVQARLLSLDNEARRLLRAASVFGEAFWAGGVAALLGAVDPRTIEPCLDALVAKEILARRGESRIPNDDELAFKHPLVRECASSLLTAEDRALGHRLAGAWLERAGERDPGVLAEHFEKGGELGRAALFHTHAAHLALRGMDFATAAEHARRAAAVTDDDEQQIEAIALSCEIDVWRLDWPAAERDAEELLSRAPEGSAPWAQGLSAQLGAAMAAPRPFEIAEVFFALMHVASSADAVPGHTMALALGVRSLALAGELGAIAQVTAKLAAIAARARADDHVTSGWLALATAWVDLWQHGDPWAALRHAERALTCFGDAGDLRCAALARLQRAECLHRLGLFEAAARDLESVTASEPTSMLAVARSLQSALLALDTGAFQEVERVAAERVAPERLASAADAGPMSAFHEAEGHLLRSEIARRKGDAAAAEATLAPFLDALRKPSQIWQLAAVSLARSRLLLGRTEEALSIAEEAMSAVQASGGEGARGLLVRLVLAEALDAAGHADDARETLSAAHDHLFELADRITGGPARASFLERVDEHARIVALGRVWLGRRSLVAGLPGMKASR